METLASDIDYVAFVEELEAQWPPERIKALVLEHKRKMCEKILAEIKQLELDNKEARIRGVSYKDRQSFTAKIKVRRTVFNWVREEGLQAKRGTFYAREFATPDFVPLIQKYGFEQRIINAFIGGYIGYPQ